jgi:hypothetical protein
MISKDCKIRLPWIIPLKMDIPNQQCITTLNKMTTGKQLLTRQKHNKQIREV